ncbi:hypothetical protein MPSEU_000672400 [Mayamaea pseudoterrestris]|nr:hypothetical protein MPSEU_000672400 [Mayamaea pseudoterrestris]
MLRLSVAILALIAMLPNASAFAPSNSRKAFVAGSFTAKASSPTRLHSAMSCRPIGIGSATPATVLTNRDLEAVVETSDDWIQSRTGISQRHVLVEGESLRALSVTAARQALTMAGVDASDIDFVICASSSPEDLFGDATSVAHTIGCTTKTVAFDLVAACSGFLFALVTAGKFLQGTNKKALVIGADALSRWVDWDDRNVCILFGDGAAAMVVEGSDQSGILGYAMHSNGGGWGELNTSYKGEARVVDTPTPTTLTTGSYNKMAMNGKEVYKFATREVPKVLQEALDDAEMTVDQVDWLLLHQANIRIMEVVAQRLGIPMEKVITNLSKYGNTSAASIPLALDEAVRSGKVKPGDVIACSGFGAGLSWGAAIIKWGA